MRIMSQISHINTNVLLFTMCQNIPVFMYVIYFKRKKKEIRKILLVSIL